MFSCDYCEFFKNIFFTEHLWKTPSVSWKDWRTYTEISHSLTYHFFWINALSAVLCYVRFAVFLWQSLNFQKKPPEVFYKKIVLKNFLKFTERHLSQKLQKTLWHRCVPVNFKKSLRTTFPQNTSGDCFWTFFHVIAQHHFGWYLFRKQPAHSCVVYFFKYPTYVKKNSTAMIT